MGDILFNIDDILIQEVIEIAKAAGDAIMTVYETDFDVYIKEDSSPVTMADKKANAIIEEGLNRIRPSIPVLSEEGCDIMYVDRKEWDVFWIVDPLDGTKDYIKKNGEFTVNIALIEKNTPIFGVVYAPAIDLLFWGGKQLGAWRKNTQNLEEQVFVISQISKGIKIAGSRSHPSGKMKNFLSQFEEYELQPMGSSLKICLVADGTVHFYPRLGPTMEWDTAAAHAILKSAGGEMVDIKNDSPLKYNKEELLNPEFICGKYSMIKKLQY